MTAFDPTAAGFVGFLLNAAIPAAMGPERLYGHVSPLGMRLLVAATICGWVLIAAAIFSASPDGGPSWAPVVLGLRSILGALTLGALGFFLGSLAAPRLWRQPQPCASVLGLWGGYAGDLAAAALAAAVYAVALDQCARAPWSQSALGAAGVTVLQAVTYGLVVWRGLRGLMKLGEGR